MKFLVFATSMMLSLSLIAAEAVKNIDAGKSLLEWTGSKIVGKHNGHLKFKSGTLKFNGDKFVGGEFVVDMTTLTNEDLTGEMNAKLIGHLKSPDFFDVEKFKESTLKITEVKSKGKNLYAVKADLMIKGKTAPVNFDAKFEKNKASTSLSYDRTVYDVRYGSGKFFENLGDKVINDKIDLKVELHY